MTEPRIFSTQEWGATARAQQPASTAAGIVIHHMVYPNRAPLQGEEERTAAFTVARQCQRDHLKRGWIDTGQHFTLSRGGLILEGRQGSLAAARHGRVVWGAHATLTTYNRSWYGIENEGTYDQVLDMPTAQWNALVELCAHLAHWGGLDPVRIIPHREVKATECPGKLTERLADLRIAVRDRLTNL